MQTLEQQMSVYLRYHRNAKNRATHFVGVPLIIFAILIPMSWAGVPIGGFTLTLAHVFVATVLVYYFLLDIPLALAMVVVVGALLYFAQQVAALGYTTGGIWFLVCFVAGWILQLIGHVFEGRKPALVDNFFQIFIAPIFLMAEIFFALGYKRDVAERVEKLSAPRL